MVKVVQSINVMSGGKRFLLVYGSQTGQAQAISEQIRDEALGLGLEPDLQCLDQSEKKVCYKFPAPPTPRPFPGTHVGLVV